MTKRFLLLLFFFFVAPVWGGSDQRELKELKRIQDENARILAETNLGVNQLRQEVQALKGMIEENKYFFQQESEKNGKVIRDFDFRLTGIEERLLLHQRQLEEASKKPAGKVIQGEGEEAEYKRALSEINLGNYPEAMKRFEEFEKKFPHSSLADNAQYWKGEALYAGKDYNGALVEFQKVVKNFPKSEKVPGAILKQGYCLYEQQAFPDAKVFLNKVIQEYPKSDEAGEARERLKKIDQISSKLQPVTAPPAPAAPVPPPAVPASPPTTP